MKIVVVGGAGAMGRITVRDLSESPEVKEILVVDYQEEKAKEYAASFHDPRIKGSFVDAYKIDETAKLIRGYDAVINTAQHEVNVSVMKACLKTRCRHYNDLGGAFVWTRKQLELFDDFKSAGLTAVLGVGVGPGITNVMARYAYDQLDEVEAVHFEAGGVSLTDMKGIDVFIPPFGVRTILRPSLLEQAEFINGEYKTFPLNSGAEEIMFPEPIGRLTCPRAIRSELVTIPASFKDKGVKEVTYRANLTSEVEETAKCLARIGIVSNEPIKVYGVDVEVVPLEVLTAVWDRQLKEKLRGVEIKVTTVWCFRVRVIGKKNGKRVEYVPYFVARPHSHWGVDCSTGVPASIVIQMQIKGMIKEPGVWAPEQVIDTGYFFKELAKREIHIKCEIKEDIT